MQLQESRVESPGDRCPGDGDRGGGQGSVTTEREEESERLQEALVLQLKAAKKRYREQYQLFQEKQAEVKYLVKIREQMVLQMTHAFEAWKRQQQEAELTL